MGRLLTLRDLPKGAGATISSTTLLEALVNLSVLWATLEVIFPTVIPYKNLNQLTGDVVSSGQPYTDQAGDLAKRLFHSIITSLLCLSSAGSRPLLTNFQTPHRSCAMSIRLPN